MSEQKVEQATFAGGCFWCVEHAFEEIEGVLEVISGYTGGKEKSPSYEEVSSGKTGHFEAIQIRYDPKLVNYAKLLDLFWRQVDPTDPGGQFADRGLQYQTAIFYHDEEQKRVAEKSKRELENSGRYKKAIVTPLIPYSEFYKAEDYHQDYSKKNPIRYNLYRFGSGRDQYLEKVWSQKIEEKAGLSDKELQKKLSPLQYKVTQKEGTESAFDNKYWDNKQEGIYVDIVSGEALFSSTDKYDSKTGWPSFAKPLKAENIVEREDRGLFMKRIEVRSKQADSHLGHVFPDGPKPTGLRYCINSASLRFIPKKDLEKEGYGQYKKIFESETKE